MPDDTEDAIDLFVQLMPEAIEAARVFVLARTPPHLQVVMQKLVRVSLTARDEEET